MATGKISVKYDPLQLENMWLHKNKTILQNGLLDVYSYYDKIPSTTMVFHDVAEIPTLIWCKHQKEPFRVVLT